MDADLCLNVMQGDDVLCHSERYFLSLTSATKRNDERPVDGDIKKHLFHYMSTYRTVLFHYS